MGPAAAFAVVAATRSSWRWLALAHPVLTTVVVVGTGNHHWLNAIVAVVPLGLSALLHPLVPAAATAWGAMGPVGPQPVPTRWHSTGSGISAGPGLNIAPVEG
ncbi:phosphatase PAP2 family protein [Nocardia sp. CA-135953]|uniref:phosphatase PAP2 family protein n=1 Tax=Nocardia sp. CA-135953 TaxID=3239978 RepID=UPI003D972C63